MKIVQINTVTNGCTGKIAYSIKKVSEDHGHECIIAYGRGKKENNNGYRISNFLDSNFHGILTRIFDSAGLHSKLVTKKFLKMLDEYKPDIIHIHRFMDIILIMRFCLITLKETTYVLSGHCMIAGHSLDIVHTIRMFNVTDGKQNAIIAHRNIIIRQALCLIDQTETILTKNRPF